MRANLLDGFSHIAKTEANWRDREPAKISNPGEVLKRNPEYAWRIAGRRLKQPLAS